MAGSDEAGPTPEQLRDEAEYIHNLGVLMTAKTFRDFVWKLLSRCSLYDDGFAETHAAASFISGKRNVGLAILAELLAADPLAYVKLQQENTHGRPDPADEPDTD